MGRLQDVMTRRLRSSLLASWQGSLRLEAYGQTASLDLDYGQVRLVDSEKAASGMIAGAGVSQLILGSEDPNVLLESGDLHAEGMGAELVQALFPTQYPMMPGPDRF